MNEFTFKCPHCGLDYDGLEYLDTADMEGEFEMLCNSCEKEFSVEFQTTITFKCKK